MIDARLRQNNTLIGESSLSELRLMHDGEIDWMLIIPKRDVEEFIDLNDGDRAQLWSEILEVSEVFRQNSNAEKLNIGALGNMVSQLHIHIIGRSSIDRAWPGAIWGTQSKIDFDPQRISFWKDKLRNSSFAI